MKELVSLSGLEKAADTLETIEILESPVEDVSSFGIVVYKKLQTLKMSTKYKLFHLTKLHFPMLKKIIINKSRIRSIECLRNLNHLEYIDLGYNYIMSMEPLRDL